MHGYISSTQDREEEGSQVQIRPEYIEDFSQKTKHCRYSSTIEQLPSRLKALGLVPGRKNKSQKQRVGVREGNSNSQIYKAIFKFQL